jgi:hypothetical protein
MPSLRFVVALASVIVPAHAALAEDGERCLRYPNVILADLGLHVVNAGFQRNVDCHTAFQVSAGLYVPWTVNGNVLGLGGGDRPPDGVFDAAGAVIRGRVFVFPTGTAPTGFWISPFFQLAYLRGVSGSDDFGGFGQATGVSLGGTFRLGAHWLVALGAGAQFHIASFHGSTEKPGFALPGPTLDLNVGYSL